MIVGSAITIALYKFWKQLKPKSGRKKVNVQFKKETFSMQHNCSDCAAECTLRDAPRKIILKNKDLCRKVELNSD